VQLDPVARDHTMQCSDLVATRPRSGARQGDTARRCGPNVRVGYADGAVQDGRSNARGPRLDRPTITWREGVLLIESLGMVSC